jgi:hypothetical protein
MAGDAAVIRGDGNFRDDLVVGTLDGSIVFLLADGSGGFQVSDVIAATPGHPIWQLVVADMNEDDIDDVVVLNEQGITVFFGDLAGSLTFGSEISEGLPGEVKGILVGDFDEADGLDLAVLRGPWTVPSLHSWVMIVTGDGAGGFSTIDGTADLPGLDIGFLARGALLNAPYSHRRECAFAAGSGPGTTQRLYHVRTDAAGQPTVEAIPGSEGTFLFASADMDGDSLADLVLVRLDAETGAASARILYRPLP